MLQLLLHLYYAAASRPCMRNESYCNKDYRIRIYFVEEAVIVYYVEHTNVMHIMWNKLIGFFFIKIIIFLFHLLAVNKNVCMTHI